MSDDGVATGARAGGPAATAAGVRKNRVVRWTRALEAAFFDHLGATGNVSAAAEAIGIRDHHVHYRHRTNAAFAAAWEQAINAGCRVVEARMIAHLLDPATFDFEKASRMLTQRAERLKGDVRRGGPVPGVASEDETNRAILQRLAAIAARTQRESRP